MRIGQSTSADLRITSWNADGLLTIDLTWDDWDELRKDAEHLRTTGQFREC